MHGRRGYERVFVSTSMDGLLEDEEDEVNAHASSSASLDEMIARFRASASSSVSMGASSRKTRVMPTSPRRKKEIPMKEKSVMTRRTPATALRLGDLQPKKEGKSNAMRNPTPTKAISPKSTGSHDHYGVSPMPKLTNAPKPKPSLLLTPSAAKERSTRSFQPRKTARSSSSLEDYPSSSLSSESTASSILEEIEAPDATMDEESIDNLIGHDLLKLNTLVSASQSGPIRGGSAPSHTKEMITDSYRQATRFKTQDSQRSDPRASSFRLFLPSQGPTSPVVNDSLDLSARDEDNSLVIELKTMKERLQEEDRVQKQKEAATAAEAKKKEAEKEDKPTIGATIATMSEAVDTIDKALLLALRPFEIRREEMDKADAKVAAEEEKILPPTELPMATQSIVDQLEQAFGNLTREREAELKAIADAEAATKVAEEDKKKAEDAQKAADDLAAKQKEREILSLLPLDGRLMTSSLDVEDALWRLEYAEASTQHLATEREQRNALLSGLGIEMESLRLAALRQAEQIQLNAGLDQCLITNQRGINWDRTTFHLDSIDSEPQMDDEANNEVELEVTELSYGDVLQTHVVQQLDLTMLRLKHVLAIDKKEAAEAEVTRQQAEELRKKKLEQEMLEAEEKKKREADAAAARQRVMGMASLEELTWVLEEDSRLRQRLGSERAIDRLHDTLGIQSGSMHSPYEAQFSGPVKASERFDHIRAMAETWYDRDLSIFEAHNSRQEQHTGNAGRFSVQSQNGTFYDQHKQFAGQSEFARPLLRVPRSNQADHFEDNDFGHGQLSGDHSPSRWIFRHNERQAGPRRAVTRMKTGFTSGPEKLESMMHTIRALQADRREKANWFHRSDRHERLVHHN
ncbi:hypothetical protein Poli38472_010987 [Pythium oligandrum]|uniref:Uncharacterized protein n=1 Tax=Pythium oligandrum TaxID=41045 RepID=A0A8K1CF69_PYTOL|nr:hypothetical protein Poli38472_010987 [Pythium oligandrum]|eukprot:TMW61924.1 hypothetical protein Poli38472_010987 [Pythium oligandrum]